MKRTVKQPPRRAVSRSRAAVPISTRRRMEADLRAAEERVALSALDALAAHIAILDAQGTILATNKAWRDFSGGRSDRGDRAAVGENYFAHCQQHGGASALALAEGVKEVLAGRAEFSLEYGCPKNGDERWFHGRVTRFGREHSLRIVIAHEEITERVRMEREIVAVSAREQQRFGQELHDGLSQYLTGLKFKASLLEYQLQSKNLAEAADAKAISELLNEATDEASNLARRVRPVEADARGLMMALRQLAAKAAQTEGVKCACEIRRPVFIHDPNVATNAYLIAEEAIANALEHGEAKEIHIDLHETKDGVTLTVRDHGRGLPKNFSENGGLGLHMMRYRARMMGGSIELRRNATRGATVVCRFQKRIAGGA